MLGIDVLLSERKSAFPNPRALFGGGTCSHALVMTMVRKLSYLAIENKLESKILQCGQQVLWTLFQFGRVHRANSKD